MEDEKFFDEFRHKDLTGIKKFDFKKAKSAKLPQNTSSPFKNGINRDDLRHNKSGDGSTTQFTFKAQESNIFSENSNVGDVKIHKSVEPISSPGKKFSFKRKEANDAVINEVKTDTILDSLYKSTLSNKKAINCPEAQTRYLNHSLEKKEGIDNSPSKLTKSSEFSLGIKKHTFKPQDLEGSPSLLSGRTNLTFKGTFNISKYFINENRVDSSELNDTAPFLTPSKKLLETKKTENVSLNDGEQGSKTLLEQLKPITIHDSSRTNTDPSISKSKLLTKSDSSSTTTDSPILKPKKFIFKKKTFSSLTSPSFSQEKSSSNYGSGKNKEIHQSASSNCSVVLKPDHILKSSIYSTLNEEQHRDKDDVFNQNKSSENKDLRNSNAQSNKKETRNADKVEEELLMSDPVCSSQSLEITDNDYMDDDEFERRFGCLADQFNDSSMNSNEKKEMGHDRISAEFQINTSKEVDHNTEDLLKEISNIDWDDNCFEDEPIQEGFKDRDDDSEEFKGNYEHSQVMVEMLHQKFGLRSFRPHQREVINASLKQHDCFVLMPTGGGKSLCYQLPAILMPGVTVVISPLRALISDQVDKLNALDIAAAHLCSDVSKNESAQIYMKLSTREPTIKLLYLTPEKINASRAIIDMLNSLYQRGKLARFVIDEVHCLSQWGHDFRPDYKQLSRLRKNFKGVPMICLTATATKQVEQDVINILGLKTVKRFIRSFNRPNIKYQVIPKTGKGTTEDIANLIKSTFVKKSGIVYCLSRQDCDVLAEKFNGLGIKSKPYHAGMADKVREVIQREWMQDRFHVIVATIAFGMGIDKPDVRFVIHNSIPKSVEAFYQESGRAGRDGEISYSYLFYSYRDVARLQKMMLKDRNVNKNTYDAHKENLKQMVSFAENLVDCRRHLQLLHLGEHFDRRVCIRNRPTACDNCENIDNYKTMDFTEEAKDVCAIVKDLTSNENVTMLYVADIYKGAKIKKILDRGHNKHPKYGFGASMDKNDIHRILKELILKHVLSDFCTYTGDFPVVYIKTGPKFYQFFNSGSKLCISVCINKQRKRETMVKPDAPVEQGNNLNQTSGWVNASKPSTSAGVVRHTVQKQATAKLLAARKLQVVQLKVQCHEQLLEECRRLAMDRNLTLSSVMNLSAIKTMSEALPNSKEEMLKIQHVTNANYNKYGEFFLKITQEFRTKHDALLPLTTVSRPCSQQNNIENLSEDEYQSVFYSSGSQEKNSKGSTRGGVKRKRGWGAKKGGAYKKRKGFLKKKGKTSSNSADGGGGWKGKGGSSGWKGKGSGKLGLMPLHIK